MLALCKTPMALSSSQVAGLFFRNAPLSRISALAAPTSSRIQQQMLRDRLWTQFHGSKINDSKIFLPQKTSISSSCKARGRFMHGLAVAYAGSDVAGLYDLTVGQIKKVLDAGNVDYRDCLERRELVERLKETENFIPPAAQKLLQQYLHGEDPELLSSDSSEVGNPGRSEDWWMESERNTVKLFQDCSPSVANITTSRLEGITMNPVDMPQGTGSAFVWDNQGHIVTNFHVIMAGPRARITLADASTWDGEVVGVAKNKDLAVLKIAAPASQLKPITLGASQALQVGQHALAIGNPFGLDRTLTSGIISGVGRDIRSIGGAMIRGVIQTDASINPGNSGGPLLDSQGRLIGVNTAIASAGVGFAIPVDTVRRVVNELIRKGRVVRPGLGIICASDNQARQLGVDGALVLGVTEGGAAAKAGIRATKRDDYGRLVLGDVVYAVNGMSVSSVEDLLATFDEREIGEIVRITISRSGNSRDVYATLQEINE